MDSYYPKYLKYKNKYLKLKSIILNQNGGSQFPDINDSPKMIDRQRKMRKSTVKNQLGFEESAEPKVEPRKTDSRNSSSAEPKDNTKKADSRDQQRVESIAERGAEQRREEQRREEQRRAEQKRAEERREEQRREEQRREEQRRAEQRREEQKRAEQKREDQRVMNKTKKAELAFLSETSDEEPEMLSPTSSEFLSEIKQNNKVYKMREDSEEEKPRFDSVRESDVNMTETELNLPDKLIDSESEEKPKEQISFIDKIKNFFNNEKEDSSEIKELGNEPKDINKVSSVLDKKVVLSPLVVNESFDRNDLEKVKVIDGITYKTKEEFTKRFWPCLFETCDLTWEKTKWTTVDKL